MSELKTAMIADDSKMALFSARRVVGSVLPSCEIVLATGAQDARSTLDGIASEPDFALLDLNMPGMNGLELAERLRDRVQSTHLVICTANIQDRVRERVDGAGVAFMEKPITETKLNELVARVSAKVCD